MKKEYNVIMSIKVTPKQKENIQGTLRRLRKLCEREGVLKELRKHAYYEKPSDQKRRERLKTKRRQKQSLVMKQKDRKKKRQGQDQDQGTTGERPTF